MVIVYLILAVTRNPSAGGREQEGRLSAYPVPQETMEPYFPPEEPSDESNHIPPVFGPNYEMMWGGKHSGT